MNQKTTHEKRQPGTHPAFRRLMAFGRRWIPALVPIALAFTTPGVRASELHVHILKSFSYPDPDWAPDSVIEGSDGALYGTTTRLGVETDGPGAVFRINKDGTGYKVLHRFELTSEGAGRRSSKLNEGSDGLLYGTSTGEDYEVFGLDRDGSNFSVLFGFGFQNVATGNARTLDFRS
jgi:uncharacterized repeat protein (TIGR03803 family)